MLETSRNSIHLPIILTEQIPGGQHALDHIIKPRLLHLTTADSTLQLRAPEDVIFTTVRKV
jgi:hypothetical protein